MPTQEVSVLIIDAGSYRIRDNTALINAIDFIESNNNCHMILIPVFVIHPSVRSKHNQLRLVVEIMKDMYDKFKEFDIKLHCFCKDVVTVIKLISETAQIKNVFINRSYNCPEKNNVRDLEIISEAFGFNLMLSNDAVLFDKSELYLSSPDIVCTDLISKHNMNVDEYRKIYIDKKSMDYVRIRKPDRRDYSELFDIFHHNKYDNYDDYNNYDDYDNYDNYDYSFNQYQSYDQKINRKFNQISNQKFREELDVESIYEKKSHHISSKIWDDLTIIATKKNLQPINYLKNAIINGSRSKAIKILKLIDKSFNDISFINNRYFLLNPYMRYGVLSVREIYHKLHKYCYENNLFTINKSPTMMYLTHRDFVFNTIDDPSPSPTLKNQSSQTDENTTENVVNEEIINEEIFVNANTDNIIINCGLRQMMIQGILDPRVKIYMYNYFKMYDKKNKWIHDKYYSSLLDFDDLTDDTLIDMAKQISVTDVDPQTYIQSKNLQSYIDNWHV